jgi:DNA-binding response OmpR family regulator
MKERVLVAEDDDTLRHMIATVLARAGYQVIEAANGADALDILGDALLAPSRQAPQIVITDVRMPYVTGLQLLTSLRTLAIPTIIVTAFPDDHTRELARKLGAFAVLAKPFELDALLRAVTALRGY